MKFTQKFVSTGVFIFTFGLLSFAQQIKVKEKSHISHEKCGFNERHQEMLQNNPIYLQKTIEFEESVKNFVPNKAVATYKIPVVVHVMETGTALTSITDQQIKDAILNLNLRLRKITGSAGDGNGVDSGIEYVLAVRDPLGNCTSGINRFDMTGNATYMLEGVDYSSGLGISDAEIKSQIVWDQNEYYNIWLVSEFEDNNGGAGIQGYAYFASSHGQSEDGAVMLVNNMKNPSSTTLTHELGHSLNLYHTFEGDNNGSNCPTNTSCSTQGDRCCDTPPHRRSSSDCIVATNSCTGTSSNLHIHNYMDYSSDDCQNMFSADQRTRMQAAVSGTRSSFLESNGNMALVPVAPSVVDFNSSKTILCGTGQDVTFYDLSSCSPNTFMSETAWTGTSYSWNITNGTNTYTSAIQNPTINFVNTGNFSVSLTITTPQGTSTLTKTDFIVVSSTPVTACTPSSFNPPANYGYTVNNVTFNTISNTTSSGTNGEYEDFSCSMNTVVTEGTTHQLSVTITGGSSSEDFEVYINYNNDGDFADVGELVASGTVTNSTTTINTPVTIPLTATENTLLRMRVIGEAGSIIATERNCSAQLNVGDVEDYGVLVLSSCSAPVVSTQPSNSSNCSGANTSFTIANTNGGTYQWQINTGSGFSNITNDATYSGATSATLSLTSVQASMNTYLYNCVITNGCGSATSNSATLTVNASTSPTLSISRTGGDPFLCTGLRSDMSSNTQTVDATVSGYTNAPTYQWQINGSNVGTNSSSISLNANDAMLGSNLVCIVTSNDACPSSTVLTSNTHTINLVTNPGDPSISASGSTSLCTGNSINLTVTNPDGMSTYSWSEGSLNTNSITVNTAGTFFATASNNVCYTNSNSITTTLNVTPATPTISSGGTTFCQGGSVVLTSSSATGNLWSTGATSQSITVSITSSNSVTVTANGCSSLTSANTNVTANPIPAIAQGAVTDPSACFVNDGSIQITGSGTGNLSWTGTVSGSMLGVTLPITISSLGGGSYSVSFDDGCVSNTVSSTLTSPGIPVITTHPSNSNDCSGTNTSFTVANTNGGTYQWQVDTGSGFNNISDDATYFGSTSASLSLTSVQVSMTTYQYQCVVTNPCGMIISDPATLTVNASTNPTVSISQIGGDNFLCSGLRSDMSSNTQTVDATVSGYTNTPTYQWQINGSNVGTNSNSISLNSTDAMMGSNLVCIVTSNDACPSSTVLTSNTHTINLVINPSAPAITAGGSIDLCTGNSVNLSITNPDGISTYSWSEGSLNTNSITVGAAGTFFATASNNVCYTESNVISTTLTTTPAIPTILVIGATPFCEGESVTLTSSSSTNNLWSTNETTQSITVLIGGDYDVSVNELTCISTSTPVTIAVNPTPGTPSILATGPTILCTGESVVLTSSATSGNVWSTGETTQSITANITDTYSVREVVNLCSSAISNTIDVIVNSTPTVPTITTNGSTTFCEGQSVTLTSSATQNNLWSITSETSTSIIVSTPGIYTVTSGTGNCTATSDQITIVVNTNPTVTLSAIADMCNTAAPFTLSNGLPTGGIYTVDGSAQTVFNPSINTGSNTIVYSFTDPNFCSSSDTLTVNVNDCSAIGEESKLFFNIYPNPTNSKIVVEGEKLLEANLLELRDDLGRLVQTFKGNKSSITIDISSYANGIYTLVLKGIDFEEIPKIQVIK